MKTRVVFLVFALAIVKTSFSQSPDLTVQSEAGKLYLVHTVAPKENWYSVGRLFNISPKEIAPFNGTTLDKALSIGEALKIPLTPVNFSQDGLKMADESFVAVYHTVHDKETLTRISIIHDNVPVDNLQKWNRIGKEPVKAGTRLIVGYLKVKPALSALAKGANNHIAVSTPVKKTESAVVQDNNNPVAKEESIIDKPVAVVKKEINPAPAPPTSTTSENKPIVNTTSSTKHTTGSYFSSEYNEGSKSNNGLAGIFKSTSGWQDGKYYALLNNATVGTIVKISSPDTNKSIYAKVLGPLPDMKESAGLIIRISNAAASELGETEGKFNVAVSY